MRVLSQKYGHKFPGYVVSAERKSENLRQTNSRSLQLGHNNIPVDSLRVFPL